MNNQVYVVAGVERIRCARLVKEIMRRVVLQQAAETLFTENRLAREEMCHPGAGKSSRSRLPWMVSLRVIMREIFS